MVGVLKIMKGRSHDYLFLLRQREFVNCTALNRRLTKRLCTKTETRGMSGRGVKYFWLKNFEALAKLQTLKLREAVELELGMVNHLALRATLSCFSNLASLMVTGGSVS